MAETMREKIIENLAVGSAVGFLALTIAALSLVADSRTSAVERAALAPAPSSSSVALERIGDPSFDRIYEIRNAAGLSYGTVLSFGSPEGSALVGAIFSPLGELRELRYLGSCASRLPEDVKDALDGFAGANDALNRAVKALRSMPRGAKGAQEADS